MAKFVLGCSFAVLASASSGGGCIDDLAAVTKDGAAAGVAIKGLIADCKGDDRTKCQADVAALLDSLDQMQKDIAPATTDCGSHGQACVDSINKLGDDIGKIKTPAQDMADKCAGKDKSTMDCVLDGIKVGAAVATVGQDVASTVKLCKSGSNMEGIPPEVVKEIEKLVCEAVKDEVPEDKFASTTCEDLKKHVKFLPEQTCENALKTIYEDALARCPTDNGMKCATCETAVNYIIGKGAAECSIACTAAASGLGPLAPLIGAACGKICKVVESDVCAKIAKEGCAEKVCQEVHLCPTNSSLSSQVLV